MPAIIAFISGTPEPSASVLIKAL